MGFLQGRVSWERFRVESEQRGGFDGRHLEILEQNAIVESSAATDAVGFAGGKHLLDVTFDLEKNIINDALHAAIRVDSRSVPAAVKKAYFEIELAAIIADNPSGRASRTQRKEAKEAAEARCQQELDSGRYTRMKLIPFLWDGPQGVVYLGATGNSALEQFRVVFQEAFDCQLERITAGTLAHRKASERGQIKQIEDVEAAVFHAVAQHTDVSWVSKELGSLDFLGNEFLLWLWSTLETESDNIVLADKTECTVMMTRSLRLECPRAETGKDTISSDAPTQSPEASQALRTGKLPRRAGLTLVRQGAQYEVSLNAETLGVSGAGLPKIEDETGRGEHEERVEQIRHLAETVDLLYDVFCKVRLSKDWPDRLNAIREWIKKAAQSSRRGAA